MPTSRETSCTSPRATVLFRQGDAGARDVRAVRAGACGSTLGSGGHEKEIAVLGPGDFFGELSLLSDEPRSATAEAIEDSRRCSCIGRDVFAMLVQDDLDIVFRMLNIAGRSA